MKPISSINERTVKYLVVPAFKQELSKHFSKVIPFHYWISREGGSLNKEFLIDKQLRIIALYPRRPKVLSSGASSIDEDYRFYI